RGRASSSRVAKQHDPAERVLWAALRERKLAGLKFRRQHPVGPFILDFVCLPTRLVIELDGPSHDGHEEADDTRTQQLEQYGYKLLRFCNEEVFGNLELVLAGITQAAQTQ